MTNVELMNSTNDLPAFTPSLGLRYWMNKMKRTTKTTGQGNNKKNNDDNNLSNQAKLSSPTAIVTNSTTTTKRNVDIQSVGNKSLNDATSTVSISGITGSYFGLGSVNGYDIDSSLRVLHHGASSERSSFLSDDIQSNASIKSKPWISQLVSATYNNHIDGDASSNSITNSAAHHSIRTFNSTEPSPITQHVYYYGREVEGDSDDSADSAEDDEGSLDGDIFGTSYHGSHMILSDNLQQTSSNNNIFDKTESKQYQQQRRWSENGYPPHTLGRIKAGLGRLMGRDHPSSAGDNRGGLS